MKKRTTNIILDEESEEALRFFRENFSNQGIGISQSAVIRYLLKKVYQEHKKDHIQNT